MTTAGELCIVRQNRIAATPLMNSLQHFLLTPFSASVGCGLLLLTFSALRYLKLLREVRRHPVSLHRCGTTQFITLVGFIAMFMVLYLLMLTNSGPHIPQDISAISGTILFLGAVFVFITAQVTSTGLHTALSANASLQHQAVHDYLTGLPNRRLIMELLGEAMQTAPAGYALVFVDIMNFKRVNISFAHYVGDQILEQVGQRLQASMKPGDVAARLGGDDFAILLRTGSPREAVQRTQAVKAALKQPYFSGDIQFSLDCGFGLYMRTAQDTRPEHVIAKANTAMMRAKQRGRNRIAVFSRSMQDKAQLTIHFENQFRRSLRNGDFFLVFQPQYALTPQPELIGFETLVRWNHPERGIVSPAEFVPMAETTGLILHLDRYVLREACRIWGEMRASLPACRALHFSVNLSASHMDRPTFIRKLEKTLAAFEMPHESIILELTESALMSNPETAARKMQYLRSIGLHVALDDFGTGYSSLAYLTRFPCYCLKIDKSFVDNITTDENSVRVVRAIIHLAHGLGMVALAEGVETPEQLAQLQDMGCDQVQGYLLGKPMPQAALRDIIARNC